MNLFLDSGAYSIFEATTNKGKFIETDVLWEYIDRYALFLSENKDKFDVYVNVDIPFYPELTWKIQQYLEIEKKLQPLPVYHPSEDIKWLKKYADNYEYIGTGGLGQSSSKSRWHMNIGDAFWNIICDDKGMPQVKVHGFAMTSPDLIIEFPYYSADSTSWMQFGKYGLLVVPRKQKNKFVYDVPPHIISVSTRKKRKEDYKNFEHLPKIEQTHVHEYLESISLKMGSSKLEHIEFDCTKVEFPIAATEVSSIETIIERGVCNDITFRDQANLQYYLDLESNIPLWPRPWKKKRKAMLTKLPEA